MSANQLLITQENSNGEFAIKTLTPEAGKVIGFDSNLNPVMVDAGSGGGGTSTVFYSQTNLNIDGANGNFFLITLPSSAFTPLTLANIEVGKTYYFLISRATSDASILLPNTADKYATATVTIAASRYRQLAMIYTGTERIWQVSEELI